MDDSNRQRRCARECRGALVNVLLVCDRYPYPLENGQNLRIFHYVRELGAQCTFDLLCYGDAPPPQEIAGLFRRIEACPRPAHTGVGGLRSFTHRFTAEGMFPFSAQAHERLLELDRSGEYDVVWVSGWDMIQNLPAPMETPYLADVVDDGVLEYWREVQTSASLGRRARMMKRLVQNWLFEKRYFCRADHCLFVSEEDGEMFSRICRSTPTSIIHNGVDAGAFAPAGVEPEPNTLIFEGKIGFAPNADGVQYFCREILPLVQREIPSVKFYVVGKEPPEEIRRLASPHVVVTGYVDDVRPYLDRAAVFVCPLRKGAGIKNKVLQAWSMGKPVVATPESIGGLRAVEGENIMVRRTAEQFAEAVVRLLRDRELQRKLGENARNTILDAYTWTSKAKELRKVFDRTCGRRQTEKPEQCETLRSP